MKPTTPCAGCGTRYGYRPPHMAWAVRRDGRPYGLPGPICDTCRMRLIRQQADPDRPVRWENMSCDSCPFRVRCHDRELRGERLICEATDEAAGIDPRPQREDKWLINLHEDLRPVSKDWAWLEMRS